MILDHVLCFVFYSALNFGDFSMIIRVHLCYDLFIIKFVLCAIHQ
jgi:hypothetical protein